VYNGLSPDRVFFEGNSLLKKNLYMLYDVDSVHFNLITNLKDAMAKRYIYITCVTHCTTLHTSEIKLDSCVQLHHTVLKISQSIVVYSTDGF